MVAKNVSTKGRLCLRQKPELSANISTFTLTYSVKHCGSILYSISSVSQHQITMTQYKKEFPFPILFPPVVPKNVLAEWLSILNVPQFHCAGM